MRSGWPRPEADAQRAFDQFIHTYQDKYPKATECFREGSRRVTGVLRFSGGALAKLAYHQPD